MAASAATCRSLGGLDRGEGFVVVTELDEDALGLRQRLRQRHPSDQLVDERRKDPGRQRTRGVTVCQGRKFGTDPECQPRGRFGPPRDEQPYRRHPHDTATALTVVVCGLAETAYPAKCRNTGIAGRALAVQPALLIEPARLAFTERLADPDCMHGRFTLGAQPAQIRVGRYPGIRRQAPQTSANPVPQQPFGGEQGHLGVVGHHGDSAVGGRIRGDPLRAELRQDLLAGVEFDRRAQRVAHRSAEQAATQPFPLVDSHARPR